MREQFSFNWLVTLFIIVLLLSLQNSSAESNVGKCRASPRSGLKQTQFDLKATHGALEVDGYKASADCHWTITVPVSKRVKLTFDSFSVGVWQNKRPYNCNAKVQIWDGLDQFTSRDLGSYCGHTIPAPVYSTGSSMAVKFSSLKLTYGGSGFKARFEAVDKDPADMQIKVLCLASNSDTVNNNLHLNGSSGRFQSPNYPLAYPYPITCVWKISVPSGKRIKLSFESFEVGDHDRYVPCTTDFGLDFLEAKDDAGSSKTFCGRKTPSAYYSSGNSMEVKFYCGIFNSINTGFRARYQAVDKVDTAMIAGLAAGAFVFVIAVFATLCYIKRFYWSKLRSPFLFGTAHEDVSAAFPSMFRSAVGQTEVGAELPSQAPPGYPQQPSVPDQPEPNVFRVDSDVHPLKEHF